MNTCPFRDMLARVADRWRCWCSCAGEECTLRFSATEGQDRDISLRMWAPTLRHSAGRFSSPARSSNESPRVDTQLTRFRNAARTVSECALG